MVSLTSSIISVFSLFIYSLAFADNPLGLNLCKILFTIKNNKCFHIQCLILFATLLSDLLGNKNHASCPLDGLKLEHAPRA